MPHLYITGETLGATLSKFTGLNSYEDEEYIYDADITANGIQLINSSDGNDLDPYYYATISEIKSGQQINFKVSYPGMNEVDESIEVPNTAVNLNSSNISNWINGQDPDLTISWDHPAKFNFQFWWVKIEFYSEKEKLDRIQSNWGVIPGIGLDDNVYDIPNSIIPEGAKYAEISLISLNERRLGEYRSSKDDYTYVQNISAFNESEILTNKPD